MSIFKQINEKNILILSLFSFIYCWGLTFDKFQFRYLIFLPAAIAFYKIFKNKEYDQLKIPFIISVFLISHLLINFYFLDMSISFKKYVEVVAVFLISIVINYYKEMIMDNIHKIIKIFIYIFPLIFLYNLIYSYIIFEMGTGEIPGDSRLIFNCDNSLISFSRIFFKENSHLGMIAAPTIISILFFKKNFFNIFFILLFSIFIFINFIFFSTTFLVGICLSSLAFSFYFIIKKKFSKILILLLVAIPSIFLTQHDTCSKKITETKNFIINNSPLVFDSATELKKRDYRKQNKINETWPIYYNASSSVHFYSLLLATYSIKKNIFGHGINNYSVAFERYFDDLKWFNKFHNYVFVMNKTDGSNNLAKLLVEFGIFAFLLIPIFLRFLFSNDYYYYQKFFILSILITQLGRGAGYFNGGFLIGILIIIIFSLKKNASKNT